MVLTTIFVFGWFWINAPTPLILQHKFVSGDQKLLISSMVYLCISIQIHAFNSQENGTCAVHWKRFNQLKNGELREVFMAQIQAETNKLIYKLRWCGHRDSNPDSLRPRDFKSLASTSSAMPATWVTAYTNKTYAIKFFLIDFQNKNRKPLLSLVFTNPAPLRWWINQANQMLNKSM